MTETKQDIFSMADMPASLAQRASTPKLADPIRVGGTFSAVDDVRAGRDEAAAKFSGFALKPLVYDRGTTVIAWGVDNARKKREEWSRMPTAAVECARLASVIADEQRKPLVFNTADLRMTGAGRVGPVRKDGKPGVLASLPIEPDALASIFTRVSLAAGVKSPGAAMADLTWGDEDLTRVRASVMNTIAVRAETREKSEAETAARTPGQKFTASRTMLRTRLGQPDADGHRPRQIFAGVSDSYTAFDIDQVAAAVGKLSTDADLRCESSYNGRSARIALIGNSDVKPEYYVAGEIFRAGIEVRTDDTGKGGIRVSALVWRNLCLNLIIIDNAKIKIDSFRHIGSVDDLRRKLAAALKLAQSKIQYFIDSWGLACKRSLIDDVRQTGGLETALDEITNRYQRVEGAKRELLGGVFRGLADEDKIPLSLRTVDAVMGNLLDAHDDEVNESGARVHGPTRASVANALTLYAHDPRFGQRDPDVKAELEVAAGKILTARGKLPFLPADRRAA